MSKINRKQDALDYHSQGRPGKIQVIPTKPTNSQRDLALAYSPGVAEPCLKIAENTEDVYKYTAKGNLVAVISNGTAVLGLGNIGPEAGKPVMEGKGLLFKIFADIDVFDLELDTTNVDDFVKIVKALEPTFGGVNLEDIKAPECFEIERRLKAEMNIPVMHDDQHGTAIISAAALLNACELQKKKMDKIRIVVNGAGAAAISCSRLYVSLGAKKENIVMCDRSGVIRDNRENLDEIKAEFATSRKLDTLAEAMKDSDVFIGLSSADCVTEDMLKSMAKNPIVFAMANPNPEIAYELAIKSRKDIIMATGRSDYPNQVNNVLGFPYIFRGALDVRATAINEEMKIAAVKAIASLAKKSVPEAVNMAYNEKNIKFGKEYIIPKPMDLRLMTNVSAAVARAAIESGVARKTITDWDAYEEELKHRLGMDDAIMRAITNKAKSDPKRVVFAEADHYKILKAAQIVKDENIAIPILLGNKEVIERIIEESALELEGVTIIDTFKEPELMQKYGQALYEKRQRRGLTLFDATKLMRDRNYFGASMVEFGEADAMISGLTRNYVSTIKPALHVIGTAPGVNRVAGMYMMMTKKGPVFFGDTTVNVDPTAEELVDLTLLLERSVSKFNIHPRIALLSYSNFGSNEGVVPEKVRKAVKILHDQHPHIMVDGEMQGNFAINNALLKDNFPFSRLIDGPANTLIFPNLESGNIAYKLLQELGEAEAIGPILLGLNKPVHIVQLGSSVREIVNMVTLAVLDVQGKEQEVNLKKGGLLKRIAKK
ncbi:MULTISPECIES: NADP-dependent malic enzyme [Pedobacter]|uniref:Malate dehydrogenase (Oxaloacetate-decarboxylating) (NADP(+))., Phosphate acetyltransferase n=1 Tax=Pedobacter heparinus (strain ATCC 13125 / DSM 2366 / CIP 104194 / JCM 7457 / NBRC 12017 / NCIMB 9290 / NRRL B-14731 / HIM 762-3) TaxID=485917 RepID=C6XV16_PEDHD|nr:MULTISPECIES: NADP-dependent malic enzyme [Pedobacter]ACU06024.1 Malate dehydrogenase (oxaloacetate-decarboxylating) (NADP(+))., Phosphate acetyltransferase [Pedobacter heparinus DSM 2366]MBB5438784.1 malate dehydrogenase (oxaloacetate-decarboxylating)(NADP+) [Pedobacter sp. AK017]